MTINDRDFRALVEFVRGTYGINLEQKRQLIDARLSFDIARRGYSNFSSYVEKVIADPDGEEGRHMINKLSTNYTFFFRETDYAAQMKETVLPDFRARGINRLKILSAACSSGQEAYSLAMTLEMEKLLTGAAFTYEIVGTDINTDMLAAAQAGVYTEEEAAGIPDRYRRYAKHGMDGTVSMADEIRRHITFRYENLLTASAYPGYHIVFCRNVMIYFTASLRREMEKRLSQMLCPGGYLFTGTTESVDLERKYFRYIAPAFYQKR